MASTTTAKRFHHDLRSLADGYGVLCLIAERKASVMARQSGHGTRSVAPIPLNLGAWQLKQDIDRLVESLATAVGLRYRHMDTVSLLKGIMRYEPRLLARADMPAIVELTNQAAIRLDRMLNPPPETKMIGWCPACGYELRCDELELKSGYKACDKCHGEYKIKHIQRASMLRLAIGGARGTAPHISALLTCWGISVKAKTINKWRERGIIAPVGFDGDSAVFLVWDIWQAYIRRDREAGTVAKT